MNGKVSCVQIARAVFKALATKDPYTLYFVDVDSQSMDDAQVYLGGKLLGINPAVLESMFQGVATLDGSVVPITEASSTTSYCQDISLATFKGATFFELNLHATLQNLGQSPVNVEVWMELGHYEELVWKTDEHIAATQVYIPSCSGNSLDATCCASIAGQLVGPYAADPCPYVRVCFGATDHITICSATLQNKLPNATALTIRSWTPVLSA